MSAEAWASSPHSAWTMVAWLPPARVAATDQRPPSYPARCISRALVEAVAGPANVRADRPGPVS